MSTHPAVVTTAIHGPLEILQVPTVKPEAGEVRVRVEWTASTPLDLHQNDGGLLVKHPQVLGDGIAGTVVEAGPKLGNLTVGDKVSGIIALQAVAVFIIAGLWLRLERAERESLPRICDFAGDTSCQGRVWWDSTLSSWLSSDQTAATLRLLPSGSRNAA